MTCSEKPPGAQSNVAKIWQMDRRLNVRGNSSCNRVIGAGNQLSSEAVNDAVSTDLRYH